ncbi:MAG TPA: exosortase/archaeosortase family protein [Candidatus Desulfaltia sp.]|nr:exosortase/archaeosortase family protein [Candidatus Desulfaltia sp.]
MSRGEYTPRDLAVYAAAFIFFYALFLWVPSRWAELLTAQSSSAAMNALGMASSYGVEDSLVSLSLTSGVRPVHVYIIRECSAIHVLGVILGLVVPLRAPWSRKAAGVVLGSALIYAMNVIRVVLTVALTGYDVPPFTWFVTSPTVETYHYPISFLFGVIGIAATILAVDRLVLPELGDFLTQLPDTLASVIRKPKKN